MNQGVLSPLVSSLEETQTQRWGHMKTEAETEVSPTLQMGHKEEMAQKQLWWRPLQHHTLDAGRGPYSRSSRRWWGCRPSHLQCTSANSYRRPVQEVGRMSHFTDRSCWLSLHHHPPSFSCTQFPACSQCDSDWGRQSLGSRASSFPAWVFSPLNPFPPLYGVLTRSHLP